MNTELITASVLVYLLVFARIMGIFQTAPLLSSSSVPPLARAGLALLTGILVAPWVISAGYPVPESGLVFLFLMIGEAVIGISIGLILTVVFSAFIVSGQFYSVQMGFGASQVFDPLAQIQIPLMGQFLNLIAMFVFLLDKGMQKVFLTGILGSFNSIRAVDFIILKEPLYKIFISSLTIMFKQALIIAFPILGVLLLISISMGLLAKAAPQMNLLMLGFPIKISIAFLMLFVTIPFLMEAFGRIIDSSFYGISQYLDSLRGQI